MFDCDFGERFQGFGGGLAINAVGSLPRPRSELVINHRFPPSVCFNALFDELGYVILLSVASGSAIAG